jgi:SH3-like domain-containing protein
MNRRVSVRPLHLGLALALTAAAGLAQAIEFRSIATPAVLYDSPSDKGRRLFIATPGTPVEVVVTLDKWIKVRDASGQITWIASDKLSAKRTLQVTAERAVVRSQPAEAATPVFEVVRNVLLDLAEPPAAGWVKVRHAGGGSGYLRVHEVWGL